VAAIALLAKDSTNTVNIVMNRSFAIFTPVFLTLSFLPHQRALPDKFSKVLRHAIDPRQSPRKLLPGQARSLPFPQR
jgi:hypothetical protein